MIYDLTKKIIKKNRQQRLFIIESKTKTKTKKTTSSSLTAYTMSRATRP